MKERISFVISNSGKTKTEFAKELKVSAAFVSQMCSGASKPSDRTIADICRIFNVNKLWLETGAGEPFQKMSRSEKLAEIFGSSIAVYGPEKRAFIEAVAQLPEDVFPTFVKAWIEAAEQMKKSLEEK